MSRHFKRNLSIGFGLSLFILIISTAASIISINELLKSADVVDRTNMIISHVGNTFSYLKDAETGQRGYLITQEEEFLKPYNGAYDSAMSSLSKVLDLTADQHIRILALDLKEVITRRIRIIDDVIERKKRGEAITLPMMRAGKQQMDEARIIVDKIIVSEKNSLAKRDATLTSLKKYSRILIVFAAFFAILITVIFFYRVRNDFRKRLLLEINLRKTEEETSRRIAVIEGVADKISSKNYSVRITDETRDSLGSLGDSINNMAESLQFSFGALSDKEWIQAGLNHLSEKMLGQQAVDELTDNILNFVCNYTRSEVGALYLLINENELKLSSSYALEIDHS
ncbi:MAG: CHASE3 domain-containing protein, partial [Chitinophagaceae bacterium]